MVQIFQISTNINIRIYNNYYKNIKNQLKMNNKTNKVDTVISPLRSMG